MFFTFTAAVENKFIGFFSLDNIEIFFTFTAVVENKILGFY